MRRTSALVRLEKKLAEDPCALLTAAEIRMVDREVRRTLMSSFPGIEAHLPTARTLTPNNSPYAGHRPLLCGWQVAPCIDLGRALQLMAQPLTRTQTRTSVTRLLEAWRAGDADAADQLFALVYGDLRALARRQLARLRPGETLAPTVLVHEAYLKFAERSAPAVVDRQHFFAVAARAMRLIVIDHIRRRRARKRDAGAGGPIALSSSVAAPTEMALTDVMAMNDALDQLAALDPRQVQVVELRFFAGLELKEIAAMLETSERTVKRDWQRARAFLYASLR